jgi:DNA-binding HxlR family transcriptional regulator
VLSYGQFCPVAKAAEVIGERWTLLIMREVLCGSRRYADLQQGLGRISPSVLSQRLKTLCGAGLLEKKKAEGAWEYHPTQCGQELLPIVELAGTWGQRWVRSRMTKDELDLELLLLELQRGIDIQRLPKRTIIQLEFFDQPAQTRRWWLVLDGGQLDLCTQPPDRKPSIVLSTRTKTLAQVWMGDMEIKAAMAEGLLRLDAPAELKRNPRAWLRYSSLSQVRPAVV